MDQHKRSRDSKVESSRMSWAALDRMSRGSYRSRPRVAAAWLKKGAWTPAKTSKKKREGVVGPWDCPRSEDGCRAGGGELGFSGVSESLDPEASELHAASEDEEASG